MNLEQQVIVLNEKVDALQVELDNVLHMTAPQRLACALKRICERRRLDRVEFTLPVTKATLALQVGIEQETLSRSIHKLTQHGIAVAGKTVMIFDNQKTRRTVCDGCAGRWRCSAY